MSKQNTPPGNQQAHPVVSDSQQLTPGYWAIPETGDVLRVERDGVREGMSPLFRLMSGEKRTFVRLTEDLNTPKSKLSQIASCDADVKINIG